MTDPTENWGESVTEAFLWGLLGASSLVLGGLVVRWHSPSDRILGLVMGFGSGVLLSAVSFELIEEALSTADGLGGVPIGFFAGAILFTIADALLQRRSKQSGDGATAEESADGISIALGTVLDGVPESAVLGLSLLTSGQIGASMLVAVFLSNLPEAVAASSNLTSSGWGAARILRLWVGIALVCAVSSALGFRLLDGASPAAIAFTLAFAAGSVLAMLTTSMIPEAYEKAGPTVGLATTCGFALSLAIDVLGS